jgi:hypothetical protein
LMWRSERTNLIKVENELKVLKDNRPEIELVFDESDSRFVRDFHGKLHGALLGRKWYIGVKNSSKTRNVDDISIRALESEFVAFSFAQRSKVQGQMFGNEHLFYQKDTLEPGVMEIVELWGIGSDPMHESGDVFKKTHEFIIEARARDAETKRLVLRYVPTTPPLITNTDNERRIL